MATVDHAGQTEPARALGPKAWVPWRHLARVLRVGLGLLFLWASVPKLTQPFDFLSSVYDYELVGPQLGLAVAFALPWIELILGTCLLLGLLERGALTLTMLLLSVFLLARWLAFSQDLPIPCGCCPRQQNILSAWHIAESVGLFLSAAAALGTTLMASRRQEEGTASA